MKKIVILILFIIPCLGFSQDTLTYKGNGRIFNSSQQKLTSEEVRSLFASNPQALNLYNAGKTKQTVGNILMWTGGITVIGKFISNATASKTAESHFAFYDYNGNPVYYSTRKTPTNTLFAVGTAMVLIALPIKIGFLKKINRAVSLVNEDLKNPKTSFNIESTSFVSNSNGFGISITF
jgi:hypothetical protein